MDLDEAFNKLEKRLDQMSILEISERRTKIQTRLLKTFAITLWVMFMSGMLVFVFYSRFALAFPGVFLTQHGTLNALIDAAFKDGEPFRKKDFEVKDYVRRDNIKEIKMDCTFPSKTTFETTSGRSVSSKTFCYGPFKYAVIKIQGNNFQFYFDDSLLKEHLDEELAATINRFVQEARYEVNTELTINDSWDE